MRRHSSPPPWAVVGEVLQPCDERRSLIGIAQSLLHYEQRTI